MGRWWWFQTVPVRAQAEGAADGHGAGRHVRRKRRTLPAAVEDTPTDSRELLARVDFAPDTDAGMESMLGFRQDLGFAGSVQSVAAVAIHPEIEGPGSMAAGDWMKLQCAPGRR